MAEIHQNGPEGYQPFKERLRTIPDVQLMAQDLVQQAAIHAVSYLLNLGCNETLAVKMLNFLRENAQNIRTEARCRCNPAQFGKE